MFLWFIRTSDQKSIVWEEFLDAHSLFLFFKFSEQFQGALVKTREAILTSLWVLNKNSFLSFMLSQCILFALKQNDN